MTADELYGLPLRYLINRDIEDEWEAKDDEVIVVGPDHIRKTKRGISVKYCTLYKDGKALDPGTDQKKYTPETSIYYKNLHDQFGITQKYGFKLIVLDNLNDPTFNEFCVRRAVDLAFVYKLGVILKNPQLSFNALDLLKHPDVFGMIIDRAGTPATMDKLRRDAGKPLLPIWYIGSGEREALDNIAIDAVHYHHIGVSFSSKGEYQNSIDILRPKVRIPENALKEEKS